MIAGHLSDGGAGAIAAAFLVPPSRHPYPSCAASERLPFERDAGMVAAKAERRQAGEDPEGDGC